MEQKSAHQGSEQISLNFDLSKGLAYYPERNCPPAPVLIAFGSAPLHMCRQEGSFNFPKAIDDMTKGKIHSGQLLRSFRMFGKTKCQDHWTDLLFQYGKRAFIYGDEARIVSYASREEQAERMLIEFAKEYMIPAAPKGGDFQLIRVDGNEIDSHTVPLEPEYTLSEEAFALHYSADTGGWHKDFVKKLKTRRQGLTILEGNPGTGKTSYLRHLMGILKETHRFYFIPPATMEMLSSPKFIGFWAQERNSYLDKKLVVILEDADAVLMTRGSDNRDEVSALLNLTDGMLGDFLSLQIICTINCPVSDIDQALLRPGRLISHRKFERLTSEEASRLAAHLGRSLPQKEDYLLAEIFSEEEEAVGSKPRMGFGG